jgi:hypothetical protein
MMGKRGGKRWLREGRKRARREPSYVEEARRTVFDRNSGNEVGEESGVIGGVAGSLLGLRT